jgi:hypothetical protein
MVPSCAFMVLEIRNLEIHHKMLHSFMIPISLLKFCYLFGFPLGFQTFSTQFIILPVKDFYNKTTN